VLRQPFFDREHDPFRQHELGRGRCQPHNQFCNALRGSTRVEGAFSDSPSWRSSGEKAPQLVDITPG
jgi:hypothetical protein